MEKRKSQKTRWQLLHYFKYGHIFCALPNPVCLERSYSIWNIQFLGVVVCEFSPPFALTFSIIKTQIHILEQEKEAIEEIWPPYVLEIIFDAKMG